MLSFYVRCYNIVMGFGFWVHLDKSVGKKMKKCLKKLLGSVVKESFPKKEIISNNREKK